MKRGTFQHEMVGNISLGELIHRELVEREITRLWPKLRQADYGTIQDPDGHITTLDGLAHVVIDDTGVSPATCMILRRDMIIMHAEQIGVIKDRADIPAEARRDDVRIILVLDAGGATFFWLEASDYAPTAGGGE